MLLLKLEQDTIPSPLVSQSVIWETDGDCGRLPGSNSPLLDAGVVEAMLTLTGQK